MKIYFFQNLILAWLYDRSYDFSESNKIIVLLCMLLNIKCIILLNMLHDLYQVAWDLMACNDVAW